MSTENRGPLEYLGDFLGLLTRLSNVAGTFVETRVGNVTALVRMEVRRAAKVFALALFAAVMASGAAAFAAVSILAALGEEHRVLGAALIALCFALLAVLAVLLARSPK
jgi:hypothetical protein